MKTILLIISFCVFSTLAFSQKDRESYLYEFGITTENDNYSFTFNDGYYTNGLILQYNQRAKWKTSEKLINIISEYKLGQLIFVSQSWQNKTPQTIDRPLSGYLFLQKGYKFFYKKGNVLQTAAAIGGTGKTSFARQVQTWYHSLTGLPQIEGWVFQLNGEPSLNLFAQYDYNILGDTKGNRNIELMLTTAANFGNAFINASYGLQIKFGNFESPNKSGYYNARIGKSAGEKLKRNAEVFIYFYPQIILQGYNATVQGPLFNEEKGTIFSDISSLLYKHSWGIFYSQRRWKLDIHFVKKNREAKSMRENESYGSITIAYRFGKQKPEPGFDSGLIK